MSYKLPDDWYIEPTGESLILNQKKVAAEIERLRAIPKCDPFHCTFGNTHWTATMAENERLTAALAWIEDQDPQIVAAARAKFAILEQSTPPKEG